VPAASTIGRVLQRHGVTRKVRRRRPVSQPDRTTRTAASGPNVVWATDCKGWFRTQDGQRGDPLTGSDLYSRYVLACRLVPTQRIVDVRPVFRPGFRRFGLPEVLRVDHGLPCGSHGVAGLSQLSAWWLQRGIRVACIQPAHPEQNGGHERMHRTLTAETAWPPAATPQAQQMRFDRWRYTFHHERPHEALGMPCPAGRYVPSGRRYPDHPPPFRYPLHYHLRRVKRQGVITWRNRPLLPWRGPARAGRGPGRRRRRGVRRLPRGTAPGATGWRGPAPPDPAPRHHPVGCAVRAAGCNTCHLCLRTICYRCLGLYTSRASIGSLPQDCGKRPASDGGQNPVVVGTLARIRGTLQAEARARAPSPLSGNGVGSLRRGAARPDAANFRKGTSSESGRPPARGTAMVERPIRWKKSSATRIGSRGRWHVRRGKTAADSAGTRSSSHTPNRSVADAIKSTVPQIGGMREPHDHDLYVEHHTGHPHVRRSRRSATISASLSFTVTVVTPDTLADARAPSMAARVQARQTVRIASSSTRKTGRAIAKGNRPSRSRRRPPPWHNVTASEPLRPPCPPSTLATFRVGTSPFHDE
jgi:hypothetical protein